MSLFDDISKSWFSSALVGIGAALVAPVVFPALGSGIRPLAKSIVKGGIVVYDKAKELVAEAGEEMSDLVAEVRSEMETEGTTAESESAPGSAAERPKASAAREEGRKKS
jgi:hypothetical protein